MDNGGIFSESLNIVRSTSKGSIHLQNRANLNTLKNTRLGKELEAGNENCGEEIVLELTADHVFATRPI